MKSRECLLSPTSLQGWQLGGDWGGVGVGSEVPEEFPKEH